MLSVKEGAVIVYSYIGYVTQEKKAVPGVMNVTLKEDTKTLDEVVVVGYGVQKKSSVTGAISQVKTEDMQNRTISNAPAALQGKECWCAGYPDLCRTGLLAYGTCARLLVQCVLQSALCGGWCPPIRH